MRCESGNDINKNEEIAPAFGKSKKFTKQKIRVLENPDLSPFSGTGREKQGEPLPVFGWRESYNHSEYL
ncbi:MAG: hypothetical protein DU429_08685 [Candidatus Tokpelaia sp.]|nr:MAG: hypothetical protein DU430_09125 [Candidatus Tokpelaia sp.]KAA6205051.1 MAG: hypothetical protein DU429_08685 [Candidatus Tokpelaia sp.]